jgi:pimeloyl-ACP methyl ester carboxylesterase
MATASKPVDEQVRPFRIEVADEQLDDLQDRLARTRWPEELPGEGWSLGIPSDYLQELAEYWRMEYDWREHEARLNELPQFMTTIDGASLHFVHVRSPEPDAMPLLLSHGWPGSIVEFMQVYRPLSDPRAHGADPTDAFHIVAPSLPGYGFSGPVLDPGWDIRRIAMAFAALMARLGYKRYGAHGGDWGGAICRDLGVIDPDHLAALHLTFFGSAMPDPADAEKDADVRHSLAQANRYFTELSAYFTLQATRPRTLAYALTDSPVGQLAWIAERFKDWTDSETRPEDAVDRDQLLTNVMLYWLTRTAGSSARLYHESPTIGDPPDQPTRVPTGVAAMPHDLVVPVRRSAERANNIVQWTDMPRGGHFAAMEEPDLVVDDIRSLFRRVRQHDG